MEEHRDSGSAEIGEILHYWFRAAPEATRVNAEKGSLWSKNDRTDREIEQRFGKLVESAERGELVAWTATPRGMLALILLCDQFPRNIRRGSSGAFALDERARKLAERAIEAGQNQALRPIERVFLYLPFEHSESLPDQERSMELFRRLAEEAPREEKVLFDGFLDFARRHHAIVARFGRFPHRNAVLGRTSTPEEIAFLNRPGSSF